jgi:hypothetical protein
MCRREVLGSICPIPCGCLILRLIILPTYLKPSPFSRYRSQSTSLHPLLKDHPRNLNHVTLQLEVTIPGTESKDAELFPKAVLCAVLHPAIALVLDLIVGAIATILMASTKFFKNNINAATIGIGLNLVLTFNHALTQCIMSWTTLETSTGCNPCASFCSRYPFGRTSSLPAASSKYLAFPTYCQV